MKNLKRLANKYHNDIKLFLIIFLAATSETLVSFLINSVVA